MAREATITIAVPLDDMAGFEDVKTVVDAITHNALTLRPGEFERDDAPAPLVYGRVVHYGWHDQRVWT